MTTSSASSEGPVGITGASGMVGGALAEALVQAGVAVRRLPRPQAGWDAAAVRGCAAVVHLAGAAVGQRWSAAHRAAIRDSRVAGTAILAAALAALPRPPAVLVSVSATGYYGDAGERPCGEDAPNGGGFLAGVCRDWEAAAAPAAAAGIRVVLPRLGVVLSRRGGALGRMLPAFRCALGGRLGSGRQWMPWIGLEDAVGVLRRCLGDARLEGPVNAVRGAVRQAEFAAALAAAVHRPALLPAPAWLLSALLGEQARELLLASCRARPDRLEAVGHVWTHGLLADCLRREAAG